MRSLPPPSPCSETGRATRRARSNPASRDSRGRLTASYSSWKLRSLDQQSEQFPSPFFLELYRAASGQPRADYTELADALPSAAGFSPGPHAALDETEWWLSELTRARGASGGAAAEAVAALYPHLRGRAPRRGGARIGRVHGLRRLGAAGHPGARSRAPAAPRSPHRGSSCSRPARSVTSSATFSASRRPRPRSATARAGSTRSWRARCCTTSSALFLERITATRREADRRRGTPRSSRRSPRSRSRPGATGSPRAARSRSPSGARSILFACRTFLRLEEEHCRERHAALLRGAVRDCRASTIARPIASREPVAIDAGARPLVRAARLDRPGRRGAGRRLPGLGLQDGRRVPVLGGARPRRRPADPVRALRPGPRGAARARGLPAPGVALGLLLSGPAGRGPAHSGCRSTSERRARRSNRLMDLLAAGAFPHALAAGDCRFCDFESVCGGSGAASDARKSQARARRRSTRSEPSGRCMTKTDRRAAARRRSARARSARISARRILVEAAAGTGKTESLVDRMVALVREGATTIDRLSAVTFTIRAAAELSQRFQTRLEQAARATTGRGAAPRRGARSRGSTPPSSAPSTRSARASCASVPSRPASIRDSRRWSSRRTRSRAARPGSATPRSCSRARARCCRGSRRSACSSRSCDRPSRRCARTRTSCRRSPAETPTPDFAAARARDRGVPRRARAPRCRGDPAAGGWTDYEEAVRRALAARVAPAARRPGGASWKSWTRSIARARSPTGGRAAAGRVRGPRAGTSSSPRSGRGASTGTRSSSPSSSPAVRDYAAWRRRHGRLNFQDLLLLARDLLRDHPAVRGDFQKRFPPILVDEFQDTDPIQAEILFYLTGRDVKERDWRAAVPLPGSLFVVGDPKQSIYRFRRADILTYGLVRDRIAAVRPRAAPLDELPLDRAPLCVGQPRLRRDGFFPPRAPRGAGRLRAARAAPRVGRPGGLPPRGPHGDRRRGRGRRAGRPAHRARDRSRGRQRGPPPGRLPRALPQPPVHVRLRARARGRGHPERARGRRSLRRLGGARGAAAAARGARRPGRSGRRGSPSCAARSSASTTRRSTASCGPAVVSPIAADRFPRNRRSAHRARAAASRARPTAGWRRYRRPPRSRASPSASAGSRTPPPRELGDSRAGNLLKALAAARRFSADGLDFADVVAELDAHDRRADTSRR